MRLYSLHAFEEKYIDKDTDENVLIEVPKGQPILIRGSDYYLNCARDFEVSDGRKSIISVRFYNGNDKPVHIEKGQVIAEGIKL